MRYVEEIVRNLVAELRLWLGRRRGAASPPGVAAPTVRAFTAPGSPPPERLASPTAAAQRSTPRGHSS